MSYRETSQMFLANRQYKDQQEEESWALASILCLKELRRMNNKINPQTTPKVPPKLPPNTKIKAQTTY